MLFLLGFFGFKNKEETTGTYVKQSSIAPIRAKLKVSAIGLNILPSTPSKVKIGIKIIKMMNCPKMAEFIIFEALFRVIASICSCFIDFSKRCKSSLLAIIVNVIYSTIITAPSIIIPKSMAPKLIKLASILKMLINEIANNKLKGITEATTKPDRILPNNKTTIKITIRDPIIKFSEIV